MTKETQPEEVPAPASSGQEHYVHGYSEEWQEYHGSRTGADDASFLVPHLHAGMSLLDCGCGPGSITCDLAAIVAPGQVVGTDISEKQLAHARRLAEQRGIANVRFELGSIYELRFPDASFDAAFASHVLEHLREPVRAMREMRRVLKPGGIVGVVDTDMGAYLDAHNTIPLLQRGFDLFLRVAEHNGASQLYARHQRRLLREAGFVRTEGYAIAECFGTLERTRLFGRAAAQQWREPAFVATALEHGWADRATLESIAAELEAYGEDPDAYWAMLNPAAVGWVPD